MTEFDKVQIFLALRLIQGIDKMISYLIISSYESITTFIVGEKYHLSSENIE